MSIISFHFVLDLLNYFSNGSFFASDSLHLLNLMEIRFDQKDISIKKLFTWAFKYYKELLLDLFLHVLFKNP